MEIEARPKLDDLMLGLARVVQLLVSGYVASRLRLRVRRSGGGLAPSHPRYGDAASWFSAYPSAVATTPSMPANPRFASALIETPNLSQSRIGMLFDTKRPALCL